jgi:hypothetical protein
MQAQRDASTTRVKTLFQAATNAALPTVYRTASGAFCVTAFGVIVTGSERTALPKQSLGRSFVATKP